MTSKLPFGGELVRLGNLIKPAKVERCGSRDLPVLSMTMHDGITRQSDRFKKTIASRDTSAYKVVRPGQLVVGFPINEGVIYVQNFETSGIMSPAYKVWDVDSKRILAPYLEAVLHSPQSMAYYAKKMRGTTARRRTITDANLLAMQIPLPNFEGQFRAVKSLARIKGHMAIAGQQIDALSELVKSRFVEMFEGNDAWDLKRLEDCCVSVDDIKCGPFGSQLHKDDYLDKGIPVWGIPEVNDGFSRLPDRFVSPENAKRLAAYTIRPGDIALTRKGNVGQAALFPIGQEVGIIHSDVLRIRVNTRLVDPTFLIEQFHSSHIVRRQIMSASTGAIMAGTNVTKLKKIVVAVPPISLQHEFAEFSAKADKSRFGIQREGTSVLDFKAPVVWLGADDVRGGELRSKS
ncbi:MAG: hypothetical protein PUF58_03325 [Collinsella sp.]|nr:hypothetical protein [Collinsella sp.]